MSGSETNIIPDDVVTESARMATTADDLRSRLSEISARIRAIVDDEPWGHDGPGEACRRSLLGSGDGAEGNAVENLLAGGDAACGNAYALAENAGTGAIETELEDEQTRSELEQIVAESQARE